MDKELKGQLSILIEDDPNEVNPHFYLSRKCPHWSQEQNKRFRLYRVDGVNSSSKPLGRTWDGRDQEWVGSDFGLYWDDMLRRAKPREIRRILMERV